MTKRREADVQPQCETKTMSPHAIGYLLVAVLVTGYLFFEGFDFGVGILLPFLGRNDADRRVMLRTIRPFWSRNEVWLLAAAGAIFAVFPHGFAILWQRFYAPLTLLFVTLSARVIGLELRTDRFDRVERRAFADWCIFGGSLVPAAICGVIVTRVAQGLPIGPHGELFAGVGVLLTPFALLGGAVAVLMFALHGGTFLALRAPVELSARARRLACILWFPAGAFLAIFAMHGSWHTRLFSDEARLSIDFARGLVITSYAAILLFLLRRRDGWAFAVNSLTVVLATAIVFHGLFPRLLPSSLTRNWDLTVHNTPGDPLTMQTTLVITAFLVPMVLLYLGWGCWTFHKRVVVSSSAHDVGR